jgi:hypothetical protein
MSSRHSPYPPTRTDPESRLLRSPRPLLGNPPEPKPAHPEFLNSKQVFLSVPRRRRVNGESLGSCGGCAMVRLHRASLCARYVGRAT